MSATNIMLDFAAKLRQRKERSDNLKFKVVDASTDPSDLIRLTRAALKETRFGYIEYSEDKARKLFADVVSKPDRMTLLAAYDGGRAVGIVYATVGAYFLGTGTLLCSVHTIYVDKAKRSGLGGGAIALGLIKGVETWAAARNAKEIMVYDTSGIAPKLTQRFLCRSSYKTIGGNYGRKIYVP